MIPVMAFFTRRNILAGEELTFNYSSGLGAQDRDGDGDGDGAGEGEGVRRMIPCHCGATGCSGFLPFEPTS